MLNAQQQFTLTPAKNNESKTALIQIVGRKHYSEHTENYPVSNKKELINLIKINNQPANNEQGEHSAYIINAFEQEQSKVTQWRFSALPKAWLNLPETLLLSKALKAEQVINTNIFTSMFVTQHQQSVCSALTSQLVNSPERFATMFGVPCNQVINLNEPQQFTQMLMQGLNSQPKLALTSFFTLPEQAINKAGLKKVGGVFAGLFIAYTALTSGYLVYKTHALQSQLEQNKGSVNQALTTLERFQTSSDTLKSLQSFTNNQQIASSLFFVLQQLFTTAELSNIRFEDDRYVIRGTADKATDALQIIINNERVNNAKFDYPSRKERRGESFVISFTLNTQQDQAVTTIANAKNEAE